MAINHGKGLHHHHLRKRIHEKLEEYPHPEKMVNLYDKFIYLVAIVGPISNLPQLYMVWGEKNVAGISIHSWFFFSFISLTWLIYGIIHKDRHLLIMNGALVVIQAFIAIGAMYYG